MSERPVALVSGTSRGIGFHVAEHLCRSGFDVIGCSRTAATGTLGAQYHHEIADVTSERSVVELMSKVRSDFGRLDVVVNNAAINPTLALALLTSFAAAADTITTNFLGTFLLSREAGKLMMRRKFGRIVNLGSMAVRHEVAGESIYTASKAAIHSFTRVLAKELAPHGITCNVIAPAAVPTGLTEAIDPDALQRVLQRNAIPEIGKMSDIMNALDWLIAPSSSAITGQVVYLGGA